MFPMFGYINQTLIYNAWNNDFDKIRKGEFCSLFKTQIEAENIDVGKLCIFDCTNEGIDSDDIDLMYNTIKDDFPELEIRVLFNVPETKITTYKYRCFPEHMVAHCHFLSHVNALDIEWKDLSIKKYFISLQRRASISRVKFTKLLLDNFNESQYVLSCGSHSNKWLNKTQDLIDAIQPYSLPILVDGLIDSDKKQHYHDNVLFFECFFNIISETSSQTDSDSWKKVFLTEKSFKAFAYRQLPVWFAVPNTVREVRKLGFDVFDDIIDHSYDALNNPEERMNAVVKEIQRLCEQYSIEKTQQLRNKLWPRISKNVKLLRELDKTHAIKKRKLIMELIHEF